MSLNNTTPRVEMELHPSREAGETFLNIVQSVDSLQ